MTFTADIARLNAEKTHEMFTALPSIHKAILYRSLLAYRNQVQSSVFSLNTYPAEMDEVTLMLQIASFQLGELKELIDLMENTIEVDELNILPHFHETTTHI